MQVSVIIPCRNEAGRIGHQLVALSQQVVDFDWEVIVADNGSTDGTVKIVERFSELVPNLRVIHAQGRRGAAHARNAAVRVARGEWLAFVDADDAVGLGWLKAMAKALAKHAVVASRFDGDWLNPASPSRPLGQQHQIERLWYSPYLKHAGGSGLGVWRQCHEDVGGFDEGLKVLEDADYCIRLQLAGHDLHFEPEAMLHVRYKDSGGGLFRQARSWARANTLLYRRYGSRRQTAARSWKSYADGLWAMLRSARNLRSARARAAMIWQGGWHLGLLEGALMHGVAPVTRLR